MAGRALPEGREITFRLSHRIAASPEAVYDTLADVRSHLEWAGSKAKKNFRLTGIEAGDAPAGQGTQWTSSGVAPDGMFSDRSMVTEAVRPSTFEFATDAHVTFKKGGEGDWKVVNRYEITPDGDGSRVTYTQRITKATELGPAKMMLNPVLGVIGRMMVSGLVKPAMRSLAATAQQRRGS
jgi:uncharacterized protein YndB with AHSA1/START domain